MKTYKIDNVQRGLEDGSRRPVVSNRTKEIDKLLKWKLSEARVFAGDVVAYTMVGLDVPPDKKAELQEQMEKISWLTKRRVKSLHQISEKEFKKTVEYTEEMDKVPEVDEDWRDRKINETFEACGNRLRERLEWQMKKMDIKGTTGNHPFWHAQAWQTLDSMSMLSVDVTEEEIKLREKIEAYKADKKKRAAEEEKQYKAELKTELEEVAKDISERYKPIQKSPDDDIFAREKARGTAHRGSERGRP